MRGFDNFAGDLPKLVWTRPLDDLNQKSLKWPHLLINHSFIWGRGIKKINDDIRLNGFRDLNVVANDSVRCGVSTGHVRF